MRQHSLVSRGVRLCRIARHLGLLGQRSTGLNFIPLRDTQAFFPKYVLETPVPLYYTGLHCHVKALLSTALTSTGKKSVNMPRRGGRTGFSLRTRRSPVTLQASKSNCAWKATAKAPLLLPTSNCWSRIIAPRFCSSLPDWEEVDFGENDHLVDGLTQLYDIQEAMHDAAARFQDSKPLESGKSARSRSEQRARAIFMDSERPWEYQNERYSPRNQYSIHRRNQLRGRSPGTRRDQDNTNYGLGGHNPSAQYTGRQTEGMQPSQNHNQSRSSHSSTDQTLDRKREYEIWKQNMEKTFDIDRQRTGRRERRISRYQISHYGQEERANYGDTPIPSKNQSRTHNKYFSNYAGVPETEPGEPTERKGMHNRKERYAGYAETAHQNVATAQGMQPEGRRRKGKQKERSRAEYDAFMDNIKQNFRKQRTSRSEPRPGPAAATAVINARVQQMLAQQPYGPIKPPPPIGPHWSGPKRSQFHKWTSARAPNFNYDVEHSGPDGLEDLDNDHRSTRDRYGHYHLEPEKTSSVKFSSDLERRQPIQDYASATPVSNTHHYHKRSQLPFETQLKVDRLAQQVRPKPQHLMPKTKTHKHRNLDDFEDDEVFEPNVSLRAKTARPMIRASRVPLTRRSVTERPNRPRKAWEPTIRPDLLHLINISSFEPVQARPSPRKRKSRNLASEESYRQHTRNPIPSSTDMMGAFYTGPYELVAGQPLHSRRLKGEDSPQPPRVSYWQGMKAPAHPQPDETPEEKLDRLYDRIFQNELSRLNQDNGAEEGEGECEGGI